jgi:hypothetical protein
MEGFSFFSEEVVYRISASSKKSYTMHLSAVLLSHQIVDAWPLEAPIVILGNG